MSWFEKKRIFMDYASATPVLQEVRQVMDNYWSEHFHNPSAIYEEGEEVREAIEKNRVRIGRALGIASNGVIFTSGGTESDNLAILGVFEKSLETFKRPHIIISAIEHPAVVAAAEEVVRRGGEMSILEVDENGLVSLPMLKKLIKRTTFLVSIGLANSEIGTIEPVAKIGRVVGKYRKERQSIYPYLHTDASQAANCLKLNLDNLHADLLTLDGSKIYGPKGVGCLVVRAGVKLSPIIFGGGQEEGRRAGTLNPALISGFATAFEIAQKNAVTESTRLELLRKNFLEKISKRLPQIVSNGSADYHLPSIISIAVPGILSELVVLKLDKLGIMASVGSTCSYEGSVSGSPVIRACGRETLAESTVRFSFGRQTSLSDVKRAAEIFCQVIKSMVK